MKRPGPWLWLRYAYGGALPEQYREWVLHDVTAPTWVVRHVLRGAVQFLPFAVVLLLVIPVDKGILATGIAMGALIAQDESHHTASPPKRAIGRLRFRHRHASQAAAAASRAGAVAVNAIVPCGATNAGATMAASTAGPT